MLVVDILFRYSEYSVHWFGVTEVTNPTNEGHEYPGKIFLGVIYPCSRAWYADTNFLGRAAGDVEAVSMEFL